MVFKYLVVVSLFAVHAAVSVPTTAPTYRVKNAGELQMLEKCASSRASTEFNTYTTPVATQEVQTRRSGGRTGFDFQTKLDNFDFNMGDMGQGKFDTPENREFVKEYVTSLIFITVPSLLVLLAAFICVIPCWCSKLCGEWSACICDGKGCCGLCNDYFCGTACCPNFGLFDGACRFGPIADYPTFGCCAHYERDPNTLELEDSELQCAQKCGSPVELEEGEEYHSRDDFFAQRKKPMESRCALPNVFWLGCMVLATCAIYACGITGQVYATQMIDGISSVVTEGNCAVADAIDFVERIAKPITNISTLVGAVISDTRATIASAASLGPQLTAISAAMTTFAATMRADTCGLATYNGNSWPPATLETPASTVDSTASTITSISEGPVDTLDATLGSLDSTLVTANETLATVVVAAKKVTDGAIMEFLKDTISPINGKVSEYVDLVVNWQGITVRVLFSVLWGFTALVVAVAVVWLVMTELYECQQKKAESAGALDNIGGPHEAEGDDEAVEEVKSHKCSGWCSDCLCACFQISMVSTMHILHFAGWIMMVLALIISLVFNPMSIIMSDACVAGEHFVLHPTVRTSVLTLVGKDFVQ